MKTCSFFARAILASGVVLLLLWDASGGIVNWTNINGGLWNVATNWNPNTVPAAGDAVFITNTGMYTVTQDLHITVGSLTLGGAVGSQTLTNPGYNLTLTGASVVSTNGLLGFANGTFTGGLLTVNGRCVWAAGTWSGATLVADGGALDLVGNLDKLLSANLTNQGTITWSGVHTLYLAGSRIYNLAGGTFEIRNNQNILVSSGTPIAVNAGTIRKSSGGGVSVIAIPLINSGTLDVQSGNVGYWSGSQFNAGTAFTGAGTNTIYTGTVTFNGAITSENLEIASDNTLFLAGTHTLSGTVRWSGGTISGNMTIATNSTLNISGTADRAVSGTLINQGLMVWSGPNTIHVTGGFVTNLVGGVFEIQNNQNIYATSGLILNSGTFRKSAGGGNTTIVLPLINSGTLDVQSGTLAYWAGSQFKSGTAFLGTGTNVVYTGTVQFNGAITSENLEIASDNTFYLGGTHTLSGTVRWTGGTINGHMTVATNGTLKISGTADRAVSGTLINQGSMVWSGPNTIHVAGGFVTNLGGAVFEIQNNQNIYATSGLILNSGTIRKSAGGGNTTIVLPLINSGTLDVQSGTLAYWGGSQFKSGTAFIGMGTNVVYTGTVQFNGAITSENLEIASDNTFYLGGTHTLSGTVRWTGGTIGGNMTITTNGTLNISGTAGHALSGSLNNQGTVIWSGAHNIDDYNASITNAVGAMFEIQNNQWLALANGAPKFYNRGTIRKSTGGGDTIIFVPIVNTAVLDAQSGRLAYGTGCQFNDGTFFTGAGTNFVYTGIAMFNGSISSENLEIASDNTFSFGGNCAFSGVVNWTGGTLADGGAFTIATNSTLHIHGTADRTLVGSLTNRGTIAWSGTHNIEARLSARIVNEAGAMFEIWNNQWLTIGNGAPRVLNRGTIRKSGGGDTIIAVPVINSGTLDVQSGRIAYGDGCQFNTGSMFTGAGTNLVYTGVATFNGTIASDNLELGGASVIGTNTLTGTVRWTAGEIAEPSLVTVASNCTLHIAGTADHAIRDPLVNAGQIIWSGANTIQFIHTGTISNLAGGTFDAKADGTLAHASGVSTFRNAGLFRKSAGQGNTMINLTTFQNTGTVDVQTGQVVFVNFTQSGGRLSFGLNSSTNFGRLAFANSAALNGTLAANFNGGCYPAAGDSFALITYPSRSGALSAFDLPISHAWQTNSSIYGATALTLTVLNARPELSPLAAQTGNEEDLITFVVDVSHPDVGQSLTFSLVGEPSGATINATSGNFTWTPTEAQGPSTNVFTVRVADNGSPSLVSSQTVTVVVNEVNTEPVLQTLSDQTNHAGALLQLQAVAGDSDLPTNTLVFSVDLAPVGLTINSTNGWIRWVPSKAQVGTNAVTVRVTDNGSPALWATRSFKVIVLPPKPVRMAVRRLPSGLMEIELNASLDVDYVCEISSDLIHWESYFEIRLTESPFIYIDPESLSEPVRFYRLREQ